MSLFLLGSCSKITGMIVKRLARDNLYQKIVIGDLLPSYSLFKRFYSLKHELETVDTKTKVELIKLTTLEAINDRIGEANDVLFVTHDYAKNVMSKTTLVKEVAEDAKNKEDKTVLYVSPAEYDSYFFKDPYREYLTGETVLKRKIPSVNIIRTDVVEGAEFSSYYHENAKKATPFMALPELKTFKVVKQQVLLDQVVRILTSKATGQSVLLKGDLSVEDLSIPSKQPQVLDPMERLLDTWGMRTNFREMRRLDLNALHTLLTK